VRDHETKAMSRDLAAKVYDHWVRRRQNRPGFEVPKDKKELEKLGTHNFEVQLAAPRREHLEQLRKLGSELAPADRVALLITLELPGVEASTLLHKLSMQLARDPGATYFNEVNQADNCGCGCGCCCAAMVDLPYLDKISQHYVAKPLSIDPFNESGLSEKERDNILISDVIASYEALSSRVTKQVNERYFEMGRSFGG
jgi:hypothetical protein